MKIKESAEDYLETILQLQKTIGNVRSIDIANEMNFSKPSVSVAVKQFRENGYLTVDASGFITLTKTGLEIAECVYERHTVLTKFLVSLGVDETIASKDACRIEHDLSKESFDKIKEHCENLFG